MRVIKISSLLLVSAALLLFLIYYNHDNDVTLLEDEISSPTERFVIEHLLNKDGTIRTDLSHNERSREALAESMGLWMIYLALKDDQVQFDRAVETVKREFLSKQNLVMWEIVDGERAITNALIDDLRIIEALYRVGEHHDRNDYLKLVNKMSKAVLKYNRTDKFFIDFYDHKLKLKSDYLTLSYLNPTALRYMVADGLLSNEEMTELTDFMNQLPDDGVFYPISYDINKHTYQFEETVNLIDQLYISIYLARFDTDPSTLYSWIKESIATENILYGRYDRETLEPAVSYESVAVYALATLYSLEKNDSELALQLYELMKRQQNTDAASPYFGGYTYGETAHSFDNLLALIAERKLLNDHLIE